jgi:hypothetical protein
MVVVETARARGGDRGVGVFALRVEGAHNDTDRTDVNKKVALDDVVMGAATCWQSKTESDKTNRRRENKGRTKQDTTSSNVMNEVVSDLQARSTANVNTRSATGQSDLGSADWRRIDILRQSVAHLKSDRKQKETMRTTE